MEYTKDLDRRIHLILISFARELAEIQARPDQPEFNKALDRACAYNEAVEKLKDATAAPAMHEALKAILLDFTLVDLITLVDLRFWEIELRMHLGHLQKQRANRLYPERVELVEAKKDGVGYTSPNPCPE